MRLARPIKGALSAARRFASDRSGNYAIIVAILIPVLVGFAALAAEYGLWVYKRSEMLSAADAAAVSAATAGSNVALEANAVTASNGYENGVNGTTVTVNQPPLSGPQAGNSKAVEVIVRQPQARLLTSLFGSQPIMIRARAVAVGGGGGGCVLALNASASGAVTMAGSTNVNLNGCSLHVNSTSSSAMTTGGTLSAQSVNVVGGISGSTSGITTTQGIHTGVLSISDPYASVAVPSFSGCTRTNYRPQSDATINPGVYCAGIDLTGGVTLTLNPGIYFIDRGDLFIRGGATIRGSGVTLIFTSSTGTRWAQARIQPNANVDLTAPASGSTAGLVMFGDRRMPAGIRFDLNGGNGQKFGGAVYVPKAALTFTGSSVTGTSCSQIIADTITFTGNSEVRLNCSGTGTRAFGSSTAQLVE